MTPSVDPDHVRVCVRIEQDEDGFPGVDVERLWCRRIGSHFRVDNIPFFVRGLAYGDVITANEAGGELWADKLVAESGHGTVWVLCASEATRDEVRQEVVQLGCTSELSHLPRYVAVDVPPGVDRVAVRSMLEAGEAAGKWEYAEGVAI